MPDQRHFYDVWIVEANQVYRDLPFTVVAGWVEEGRLLEEDRVRVAGTGAWKQLAGSQLFASYFPRPDAMRTEDRAEALEPVQLDFQWMPPADDEEDDVDMIPLIDISLVLLIFFMMTAGSMLAGSIIDTPGAEHGKVIERSDRAVTIGMTFVDGQIRYFLGDQTGEALSESQLLEQVTQRMESGAPITEVILKANPRVPFEKVQQLTMGLKKRKVQRVLPAVSDKSPQEEPP